MINTFHKNLILRFIEFIYKVSNHIGIHGMPEGNLYRLFIRIISVFAGLRFLRHGIFNCISCAFLCRCFFFVTTSAQYKSDCHGTYQQNSCYFSFHFSSLSAVLAALTSLNLILCLCKQGQSIISVSFSQVRFSRLQFCKIRQMEPCAYIFHRIWTP